MEISPTIAVDAPRIPAGPQWVVFRCGDRRFVAPLDQIREILPPLPFTRIPGCGPEVCGLVGLRGRLVTVFDLGAALGLSALECARDHRLLILERGAGSTAVAVTEVMAVARARVERGGAPDSLRAPAAEIMGTCRVSDERHIALRLERVVARLLG
jgi:chemotaxis signal transduction protein